MRHNRVHQKLTVCSRTSPSVLASGLEKGKYCWFNIVSTTRTHLHGFIPPYINPNSTRPEEEPKQRRDRGRRGTEAEKEPGQKRNRASSSSNSPFLLLVSSISEHVVTSRDVSTWPQNDELSLTDLSHLTSTIDTRRGAFYSFYRWIAR